MTDKISVRIFAEGQDYDEIEASLASFKDYVASQTLAREIEVAPLSEAGDASEVEWNDSVIRISVSRL